MASFRAEIAGHFRGVDALEEELALEQLRALRAAAHVVQRLVERALEHVDRLDGRDLRHDLVERPLEGALEDLRNRMIHLVPDDVYYAHDDLTRRTQNLDESDERRNGPAQAANDATARTATTMR